MFSRELRGAVARGEITVSIRLWSRPQVKEGGRYPTCGVLIEVDSLELLPFSAVTDDDVRESGESDLEARTHPGSARGTDRGRHPGLPGRVPRGVSALWPWTASRQRLTVYRMWVAQVEA